MFQRLKKSRGIGKFRRNRWAMVSLAVIGLYAVIAAGIMLVEALDAVGERMGHRLIPANGWASMLTSGSVAERVGPRWIGGFGSESTPSRRIDQADFVFSRASEAISAATLVGPADAAGVQQKLDQAAMAERRIADLPLDELVRLRDAARALFEAFDSGKQVRVLLNKLSTAVTGAERALADLPVAGDAAKARDDASRAVEDVMFALEDLGKANASTRISAGQSEVDAWQTIADAVREGKTDGAGPKLAALREALAAELSATSPGAAGSDSPETLAKIAAIESAVQRLMPMPTGAAGLRTDIRLLLGTDASGRSIFLRGIYSAKTAIQVGVVVALLAVLIGALMGSAAAYFGGWIDIFVTWCYSTLSSLPQLVLLAVLAFMFLNTRWETTLVPIYVALTLTFWIGPARVIRGEVMKIKELEYVQAGKAIGFSRVYILIRHIIPNTSHLMFINFSLLFIGAVKTEVILTFLGIGVKEGASWGRMISDAAPEVINGVFWQIGAATFFMLVLVLAFNVVSDALQDAFDPRHVG